MTERATGCCCPTLRFLKQSLPRSLELHRNNGYYPLYFAAASEPALRQLSFLSLKVSRLSVCAIARRCRIGSRSACESPTLAPSSRSKNLWTWNRIANSGNISKKCRRLHSSICPIQFCLQQSRVISKILLCKACWRCEVVELSNALFGPFAWLAIHLALICDR